MRERSIEYLRLQQATRSPETAPDLWATPFRVGYLNVGYRRLRLSLEGVVALVKTQCPDVLFLGDLGGILGCSRAHIGHLRQRLEAALKDEWFLWTGLPVTCP